VREVVGDLWETECEARCITTNGLTLRDGTAVMGVGVAKQAKIRYPWLPKHLGRLLRARGNHVFDIGSWEGARLITFPTKHDWRDPSDPNLIRKSCQELKKLGFKGVVALPRPGCGAGGLTWAAVKPILEQELPEDNYVVIDPKS
jgi:hypothetical protein